MADVDIMFSCAKCGATRIRVRVRERKPEEPLSYWVERVASRQAAAMHTLNNPGCESGKLDLFLPLAKNTAGDVIVGATGDKLTAQESLELRDALKQAKEKDEHG